MSTTVTTRFGKHRSQSQRRFILLGCHTASGKTRTMKRSDTAATLHKFARRDWVWSHDIGGYIRYRSQPEYALEAVVIDTVTGTEVPR